jgi:HTH-type transcriptional regulator/antitoxin HipB
VLARTPVDIGLLIRDQRLKLGLDQRELAERISVSRQWVVEVEKGKPRAEIGLVLRALTALGLELNVSASTTHLSPPTARKPIDLDDVIARARGKKP